MNIYMAMPWHRGEETMQRLLNVPSLDNPTSSMLTSQASFMLEHGPLLALGTLDAESRPWATLWGGAPGFSESLGNGFIGTRTLVDGNNDPVIQALVGHVGPGEMVQPARGKLLAGLAIDLMKRKRVKVAGRMVAGAVNKVDVQVAGEPDSEQDQVQLVTKIDQSLGNCPKYLNQYEIHPVAIVRSKLLHTGPTLPEEGKALIAKSDMFFLSTITETDQDVNHRGGPSGFVRVISSSEIIYPEYSGNRLYQSLGNLRLNPKIGIVFPDYETGDALYITGTADILIGKDAAGMLPGSNLAVKVTIDEARLVKAGLPFRGVRKTPSPYNPQVRTLAAEGNIRSFVVASETGKQTARLTHKTIITPTTARFTFSLPKLAEYKPGQWVAMDLKQDLDYGYDHMRDDDPTSLNDDFVRTFTVSSAPTAGSHEFEITVRKVGPVTNFLFQQNEKAGFELGILAFGGDFTIKQVATGVTPFIAGGVGITPLLGQLPHLDTSPDRFKLLWTLKLEDVDLVKDTIRRHPKLATSTEVFFTSTSSSKHASETIEHLRKSGVKIQMRRLAKDDVDSIMSETWYLCAGKSLRKMVLSWLEGKDVIYEAFDY